MVARGQSIAQVARDAIERELPAPTDGRLGFFAVGDGSPRDASERVEELVADCILATVSSWSSPWTPTGGGSLN